MIPSIFDYMPNEALSLFQKVAATSIRETSPEIVAPDIPAEPRVDPQVAPPPDHPYSTAWKQLLPIGAGMAVGYAAGAGGPAAVNWFRQKALGHTPAPLPYHLLGGISATAGGIGGLAATILSQARQAEADRANQEYKDYVARRAASSADPSVQPPPIRT